MVVERRTRFPGLSDDPRIVEERQRYRASRSGYSGLRFASRASGRGANRIARLFAATVVGREHFVVRDVFRLSDRLDLGQFQHDAGCRYLPSGRPSLRGRLLAAGSFSGCRHFLLALSSRLLFGLADRLFLGHCGSLPPPDSLHNSSVRTSQPTSGPVQTRAKTSLVPYKFLRKALRAINVPTRMIGTRCPRLCP